MWLSSSLLKEAYQAWASEIASGLESAKALANIFCWLPGLIIAISLVSLLVPILIAEAEPVHESLVC